MSSKKKSVAAASVVGLSVLILSGCTALQSIVPAKAPNPDGKSHHVVAYNTPLAANEIWCAPLQLCWNEAMDTNGGSPLGGQSNNDIDDLNARLFEKEDVGDDHYYIYADLVKDPEKTKAEITQGLQDKLGQSSSMAIEPTIDDWFFYSMLYRKFTYRTSFAKLDPAPFGFDMFSTYPYYGVTPDTPKASSMGQNIRVLYYENEHEHAIALETKEGDMVVLVRNPVQGSAEDIWNAVADRAKKGHNADVFDAKVDEFKAPCINMDIEDSFDQLKGTTLTYQGNTYVVSSTMQKTQFKMDEKGGEVKSEAILMTSGASMGPIKPRLFHYNGDFAVLLIDAVNGIAQLPDSTDSEIYYEYADDTSFYLQNEDLFKMKPYFAARINDLALFSE